MHIYDIDPDNMDKDEFLVTLNIGEENQAFVSSLITEGTLSEEEQGKLTELFKPITDKDKTLRNEWFLAFIDEQEDIVGEYESKYGVTQTERSSYTTKAYWEKFKFFFLFGGSDPESTGLFDRKQLQKERLVLIPDILEHYNFSEIQPLVEKYRGKDAEFDQAYQLEKQKRDIENLTIQLINAWKNNKRHGNIDLSADECRVLYTIAGYSEFNEDVLSKVPKFEKDNPIHRLFLNTAVKYSRVDISERLFEGWNTVEFFNLLHNYFHSKYCHDNNEDIHNKDIDALISTIDEDVSFFRPYVKKTLEWEQNISIIQSFFPLVSKNEDDAISFLSLISQEKLTYSGYGLSYSPNMYPEFANIIAEKAALFPIIDFMSTDYTSCHGNGREFVSTVFTRYCELIMPQNNDEALLLARYEFDFWSSYKNDSIIDKHILPFIHDDGFLYKLLFISQDTEGHFWTGEDVRIKMNWIAHWIALSLVKKKKGIIEKATQKLIKNGKATVSASIIDLIRALIDEIRETIHNDIEMSYETNNGIDNFIGDSSSVFLHILFLSANGNNEENQAFCNSAYKDDIYDEEISYRLYQILYRKTHSGYDREDFLSNSLPPELLRVAICEDPAAFDTVFSIIMAKLGDTYENRRGTVQEISYLYHAKVQFDLFDIFYKRLMEENYDSCIELFTFLELYFCFEREAKVYLSNFPEKVANITERCSKLLGKFRNWRLSEQDYDCVIKAAGFLAIYHGLWRGLKPLLIAFRNSKRVLVANNLAPNDRLAFDIIGFFDHNYGRHNGSYSRYPLSTTDDDLKQLRQDMANDFVDYLKPLSPKEKERQAENYTEHERAESGFDSHYKEPSAIWRYAYVKALVDLGVKTDGKGHFLHEALKKAAENDPSEKVRKAAIKADRELNRWRDGINGNDHKRRLYETFWWLRLAHLDSLGADIDRKASERLRIVEWR
jgi:hypothetical protein